MINISVLGSTGSIGVSTLDVLGRHPERYRVFALSANRDVEGMLRQCLAHRPRYAVMADEPSAIALQQHLRDAGGDTEVLAGSEGLVAIAEHSEVDAVMAAIVGAAGMLPTLAAVRQGKRVLLANKEALVVSGHLFMEAAAQSGATVLPIDSEHNAIFQCLPHDFRRDFRGQGVRRILLTASGGPFRTFAPEALADVTPEQACAHPNWSMGRKISVDSATMMNKGLEVIEAHWLFNAAPEQIQVVVHPQSVIHSMVSYDDGSVLAQLGNPDMRTPIAHALAWPERIDSGVEELDIFAVAHLDFETPDFSRFPCLKLAYQALEAGGTAAAAMNAANEVAVQAFLERRLAFTAIASLIDGVMQRLPVRPVESLDGLLALDEEARALAEQMVSGQVF